MVDRDRGLTPDQVTAYKTFDSCSRPCCSHGATGRTYDDLADLADKAGIPTSHCLEGIKVPQEEGGPVIVPCPFGAGKGGFKAARAARPVLANDC